MSYQERYTAYQEAIETYLNTIFSAEDKPYGKLQESIRYSLLYCIGRGTRRKKL